ncbi:MAG: hypothetical protein ACO3A4_00080 [Silvanigrellaceae bacterium]
MLYRFFSAFVALTLISGFLGWMKSSSGTPTSQRLDQILDANSLFQTPVKKSKTNGKLSVVDASR